MEAYRPIGRQKLTYHPWAFQDDVDQLERDKRVERGESYPTAYHIMDENPLAQLKIQYDLAQKRQRELESALPSRSKGIYVNKEKSVLDSMQKRYRFDDRGNTAGQTALNPELWVVVPEEERKTQQLVPRVQAFGGGYYTHKPETWDNVVRRYRQEDFYKKHDSDLQTSALIGVDSPMGRLQMQAAGEDHNAKNAPMTFAVLSTNKQIRKENREKREKERAKKEIQHFKETRRKKAENKNQEKKRDTPEIVRAKALYDAIQTISKWKEDEKKKKAKRPARTATKKGK